MFRAPISRASAATAATAATAVTACCLLVTACSSVSSEDGDTPATYAVDGTFVYNTGIEDPGTFDPYRSNLVGFMAPLAYDSLLNWTPHGTFVSGLAESWEADVDGATFTLREGITCSDGSRLEATEVADALTFLSDPANGSPLYGTTIPSTPFTVTADDEARTVKVKMSRPFGFIENTIGLAPIVCDAGMDDPDSLQTSSAGTGPFELTDYEAGQSMTFTRRDNYTWGPDGANTSAEGTPSTVEVRFVTDGTTAANLLLSGELNAATIRGPERERLDARGLEMVEGAVTGQWLWFNQIGERPTGDLKVRKALISALDLDDVVKVSTGGKGEPATGLIAQEPTACPGGSMEGMLPDHDLEAAARLLDDSGWTEGADGTRTKDGRALSVAVHYVPSVSIYGKPTAELLAQQWGEIGVDVELTADTVTAQIETMFTTSDYDVYLAPFGANLPSQMVPYLSGPTPPEGLNLAGIDNPAYEGLVEEARVLPAPDSCDLWLEAEEALFAELDPVPVSRFPNAIYLADAELATNSYQLIPTSLKVLE